MLAEYWIKLPHQQVGQLTNLHTQVRIFIKYLQLALFQDPPRVILCILPIPTVLIVCFYSVGAHFISIYIYTMSILFLHYLIFVTSDSLFTMLIIYLICPLAVLNHTLYSLYIGLLIIHTQYLRSIFFMLCCLWGPVSLIHDEPLFDPRSQDGKSFLASHFYLIDQVFFINNAYKTAINAQLPYK